MKLPNIVFQSGYWNNRSGEVAGVVTDNAGSTEYKIHGKWFEALYADCGGRSKCIWRAGK